MCRSKYVSEVTEESEWLEEECDLIRENLGSCSDFEVLSLKVKWGKDKSSKNWHTNVEQGKITKGHGENR